MRTHPLPPPVSDCVMQDVQPTVVSSFGCFVFEFWVLRFRDFGVFVFDLGCFVFEFWVLRFRDLGASFSILGASFSSFGCFVFEIWVLRFRDLGASCFGLRFRVLRFRNYLHLELMQVLCVVWQVVSFYRNS